MLRLSIGCAAGFCAPLTVPLTLWHSAASSVFSADPAVLAAAGVRILHILAYRRYGAEDGEELLVLCNLTEHDVPYTLPEGWADAGKLLGNYDGRTDALRPYECVVLQK